MRASAVITAAGIGILVGDAVSGAQPDLAIIGVAFLLAGLASLLLTRLLPPRVVPPQLPDASKTVE